MAPLSVPGYIESLGRLLIFVASIALLGSLAKRIPAFLPTTTSPPRPRIVYNQTTICTDAFDEDLDHSKEQLRYFDVTLREGCFGGLVHIPRSWRHWQVEPVGDQNGFWIAFWLANEPRGRGPFLANDNNELTYSVTRLQGHGTVRFYTNTEVGSKPKKQAAVAELSPALQQQNEQKIPVVSTLNIQEGDSHICEKPDDAHYLNWHIYAAPKFLFDVHNQDDKITWANGFKGTVPVCFLVDDKGDVKNITLIKSPGEDLEKHIRERILGWRYQAGMWEDQPVKTQMMMNFNFR